jgi:hypothetical protein
VGTSVNRHRRGTGGPPCRRAVGDAGRREEQHRGRGGEETQHRGEHRALEGRDAFRRAQGGSRRVEEFERASVEDDADGLTRRRSESEEDAGFDVATFDGRRVERHSADRRTADARHRGLRTRPCREGNAAADEKGSDEIGGEGRSPSAAKPSAIVNRDDV